MPFGYPIYTREQKKILEGKSAAFGEAREEYSRRLWDVTRELERYGGEKVQTVKCLSELPEGVLGPSARKVLERYRFLAKEEKPIEKTGLTGVQLREWSKRDLSFPDTEGLRPQETFEIYDRLTKNLREDNAMLDTVCHVVKRWVDCAEGMRKALAERSEKKKQIPVANLLTLFLDVDLFTEEEGAAQFRKEKLEKAIELLEPVLGLTEREGQKEQATE